METLALVQHRVGLAALRGFSDDILPLLQLEWVTERRHQAALEAVLAAVASASSPEAQTAILQATLISVKESPFEKSYRDHSQPPAYHQGPH